MIYVIEQHQLNSENSRLIAWEGDMKKVMLIAYYSVSIVLKSAAWVILRGINKTLAFIL